MAASAPAKNSPPAGKTFPEGPSTQYLRSLVQKTIKGMALGTKVHKYWYLYRLGIGSTQHATVGGYTVWSPAAAQKNNSR